MRKVIAVEQIYDAAFDDEALSGLAIELASTLEARSALIHWIHEDGSANVLAHSGYFTDDQLALYGREFAHCDPWVGATAAAQFANRVHDLEALVPVPLFAASSFYNDYVRAMGDDTARCIGVRLQNGHGSGFIALQRGISQPSFEPMTVARLQRYSGHLMRMLAMRGRLLSVERRSAEISAAIDGIGRPALLVDRCLRLRYANKIADVLLGAGTLLRWRDGRLNASDNGAAERLQGAVEQVVGTGEPTALCFHQEGQSRIDLSIISVPDHSGARLALILVSSSDIADPTRLERLRSLYALTPSEAAIAVMLTDGLQPVEIAEQRRVSTETVRIQIKQIAFKLGCNRQAEIVRAVASLPPLHVPSAD